MRKVFVLILLNFIYMSTSFSQNSCDYHFVDNTELLKQKVGSLSIETTPGFALLVGTPEKILYQCAAGLADLKMGRTNTADTPFYIASIGKTFTAWAILDLFEQDKLNLEEKLSFYFPELPAYAEKITIYHMLNHTSGLPDHFELVGENDKITNQDVIDFAMTQDSLLFEPGYDYSYSNTAYVLLAKIIEKVSGKSYTDFIEQNFLDPLGMDHTTIIENPSDLMENRAIGYSNDNKWIKNDYENIFTTGSGGIYSTVGDLYKWYQAINKNQFLKAWTSEMAFTAPFTITGNRSYMAMGWFDETFGRHTPEVQGIKVFGAIGVLKGFRTNMHIFPDHDLVFILLSNSGDFQIGSSEIASLYLTR